MPATVTPVQSFQLLFNGVNEEEVEKTVDGTTTKTKENVAKLEFGHAADAFSQDAAWVAAMTLLHVYEVKSVSSASRSTTTLTVTFNNPKDSKAKDGDYVGLSLPFQWCGHHAGGMRDGSATVKAELSALDSAGAGTVVGNTLAAVSGCNLHVTLNADTKLADAKNYTLKVSNLPTPVSADKLWGSVLLSAGK